MQLLSLDHPCWQWLAGTVIHPKGFISKDVIEAYTLTIQNLSHWGLNNHTSGLKKVKSGSAYSALPPYSACSAYLAATQFPCAIGSTDDQRINLLQVK
eukprot:222543-Pelagomonas_calceolata.AAC.1